jgi:dihydrofolate reductase
MANYVYIAASLDGYIATPDGGIDWLADAPNPNGSDFGFAEFVSRVNGILMGRMTFDKVLGFGNWPYTIPVFVLSSTLKEIPPNLQGKAQIVSGSLAEVIGKLHEQGFKNLYIDGGRVIQSFLREDLIDELIITRFPKLLGAGIPLFSELVIPLNFIHIKTEVIQNYLVKSQYQRDKK